MCYLEVFENPECADGVVTGTEFTRKDPPGNRLTPNGVLEL